MKGGLLKGEIAVTPNKNVMLTIMLMIWSTTKNTPSSLPRIAITPNKIVTFMKHQEAHKNVSTNMQHQNSSCQNMWPNIKHQIMTSTTYQ